MLKKLFLFIVMVIFTADAFSLSCVRLDQAGYFIYSDVVFIGKVLNIKQSDVLENKEESQKSSFTFLTGVRNESIEFNVLKVFKGDLKENALVYENARFESRLILDIGSIFLVYAHLQDGKLHVYQCSNSKSLERAADDISFLTVVAKEPLSEDLMSVVRAGEEENKRIKADINKRYDILTDPSAMKKQVVYDEFGYLLAECPVYPYVYYNSLLHGKGKIYHHDGGYSEVVFNKHEAPEYWSRGQDAEKKGYARHEDFYGPFIYRNKPLELIRYNKEGGLFNGVKNKFASSGKKIYEIVYKNGKRVSLHIYYDDGRLINETRYKKGEGNWVQRIYGEMAKPGSELIYNNGRKNGVERSYYKNGILKKETNYKDDLKHGSQKYFTEDGNLKFEVIYVNDKPKEVKDHMNLQ